MDQHTYSHIASLVVVELDCIQFDYIHWAELGGTTEWIRTLALRCLKGLYQRSNHSTKLDIQKITDKKAPLFNKTGLLPFLIIVQHALLWSLKNYIAAGMHLVLVFGKK